MAHHLRCPYCKTSPAVGFFYKHLISQHLCQLFDEDTDWGKNNLRWLNATTEREKYTLYLPKGDVKYCCPSCKTAVNKPYYADKHIAHAKMNLKACEELRVLLNITPKHAPFPELAESHTPAVEIPVDKEIIYCKIIKGLIARVESETTWAYWFNKLIEDEDVERKYKNLTEMGTDIPEDDKFDFGNEFYKELKQLGYKYEDIKDISRKKLG